MSHKKAYVLLSNTGTLLSRGIKRYTRKPYNHASIAFDEELVELYSFGRKKPYNPIIAGFIQEDILKGTFARYPNATCQVFEVEITDLQFEKMLNILTEFKEREQFLGYNLLGLVGVAMNRPVFTREGRYFCSQFVAEVFVRSGLKLWDKPTCLLAPSDIGNVDDFKLIYEGKLCDYKGREKQKKKT